jgi:TolA-binding protein
MVEWLADELLRVKVFEGESSVEGTPSPLFLRAGQQVSANAKNGTVEVGPLNVVREIPANAPPEVHDAVPEGPRPADEPSNAAPPAVPAPTPVKRTNWPDAVAAGDYSGVLSDAERRGIAPVLAEGPLADLVALADAARLSGRLDLGKRALLAQRNRFPRSSAARDAAFFLGRLADDQEHSPAMAIPWYEKYMSEAPNGAFAAEALGRRMVAVSRQSGRHAARDMAIEYLKRFPSGPHASVARELSTE